MVSSVPSVPVDPKAVAAAAKTVDQSMDGAFRNFYNQAVQQVNQTPLPFAMPNAGQIPGINPNGVAAAIAQNFGNVVVDKRRVKGINESVYMTTESLTKKTPVQKESLKPDDNMVILAQAELPDDFYNQQDPLNLFDSTFEGSVSPDAVPVVSGYSNNKLDITPFQFFIDKAVDFFLRVSAMERNTDMLMEKYVQGEASLEELMIEKAKTSVAVTFSVTLVTQVSQTFKEIQNMQV